MTTSTPTPGAAPGLQENPTPCVALTNPTLYAVHRRAMRLEGLLSALWEVVPTDAASGPAYDLTEICRAEARALNREIGAIRDREEVVG